MVLKWSEINSLQEKNLGILDPSRCGMPYGISIGQLWDFLEQILQNAEHTHSYFYIHQYLKYIIQKSLAQEIVLGLSTTTQSWSIFSIWTETANFVKEYFMNQRSFLKSQSFFRKSNFSALKNCIDIQCAYSIFY